MLQHHYHGFDRAVLPALTQVAEAKARQRKRMLGKLQAAREKAEAIAAQVCTSRAAAAAMAAVLSPLLLINQH
jgi:hypothetical protein